MKKFSLYLMLLMGLCAGCDNNLPDEIFEKHVLINQNGFCWIMNWITPLSVRWITMIFSWCKWHPPIWIMIFLSI